MASSPQSSSTTSQQEASPSDTTTHSLVQYNRVSAEDEFDDAISDDSVHVAPEENEENEENATPASSEEDAGQGGNAPPGQTEPKSLPEKKKRFGSLRRRYNRVMCDHWTYELVGVFIFIATIGSIIGVLLAYQNGPTPHVMRGVSVRCSSVVLILLIN